jgi:phosphatidate cytidylyltransferase
VKDPLILRSALVLIGFLTLAQIIIAVMERMRPGRDLTEIRIRTRSWWIMLFVLEGALYLGKAALLTLVGCLSFFALREYLSRVPTRTVDRKVLFWAFLSIPAQFLLIQREALVPFLCFIPLYGISVIALRILLTGQPKGFVLALSTFQLGLLTTVYSISHIAYLPLLKDGQDYELSAGPLLFFICITQANDVFQFISGKAFGKTKIVPLISPKKTVEGFLGGVVLSSIAGAIVAPFLTSLSPAEGAIAGALLSVFGFFGDIFMSAIKRDLDIKDFSQIIPGHGGILDRVDSLIISAPLFFHFIRFLSQGSV